MVQNVRSTNTESEGNFVMIDLLMQTRPNASCSSMLIQIQVTIKVSPLLTELENVVL